MLSLKQRKQRNAPTVILGCFILFYFTLFVVRHFGLFSSSIRGRFYSQGSFGQAVVARVKFPFLSLRFVGHIALPTGLQWVWLYDQQQQKRFEFVKSRRLRNIDLRHGLCWEIKNLRAFLKLLLEKEAIMLGLEPAHAMLRSGRSTHQAVRSHVTEYLGRPQSQKVTFGNSC